MEMIKFLQYLESSGKFRKNPLCKIYRSIYQQNDNFISFSLLFFIRIFCILLKFILTDSHAMHVSILATFLSFLALSSPNSQPNVTFYSGIIVIGYNSLKNL